MITSRLILLSALNVSIRASTVQEENGFSRSFVATKGRVTSVILWLEEIDTGSCAANCVHHLQCVSFNYNRKLQKCELADRIQGDKSDDKGENDWINFSAKKANGGYGTWSPWTECIGEFGDGEQKRQRKCDNPSPINGGKHCDGTSTETKTCYVGECEKNLALNKIAKQSSEEDGRNASFANDGDCQTFARTELRKEAGWWRVDLEKIYMIKRIVLILPTSDNEDNLSVHILDNDQHWSRLKEVDLVKNVRDGLYRLKFKLNSPELAQHIKIMKSNGDGSNDQVDTSRHKRRGWMWTHNQTSRLIELWSQEECLYNSNIDEYRDQMKRENALERVRMRMEEEESPAPSSAEIHNKMKGLKIYYSSIRTKLKRGLLSGGSESSDDLPAIRWPHYNAMSFINDSISHRKGNNTNNYIVDISHSMVEHPSSLHGNSLQKRRRNENIYEKTEDEEEQLLTHAPCATCDMVRDNSNVVLNDNYRNADSDPDDIFGKLITSQLKKISEGRTKEKLKMDLQKTIFDVLYPEPPNMYYTNSH